MLLLTYTSVLAAPFPSQPLFPTDTNQHMLPAELGTLKTRVGPEKRKNLWYLSYCSSLVLAYFILGRSLTISALLSCCLNFLLLTFPQLFPETQKQYLFCACYFHCHR